MADVMPADGVQQVIEELKKQYVLVGKFKAGLIVGGFLAFLAGAGFVGYRAAFASIKNKAEDAVQRILEDEGSIALKESAERAEREARDAADTALAIVTSLTEHEARWREVVADGKLEVSELLLVDVDGVSRAKLAMSGGESAALTFFDPDGEARLTVGVQPGGTPIMSLYDAGGEIRALLMQTDDAVSFVLADNSGDAKLALTASDDGRPRVGLQSAQGLRAALLLDEHDNPELIFADGAGTQRIRLAVYAESVELRFKDANDKARAALGMGIYSSQDTGDVGDIAMLLMDSNGVVRVAAYVDLEGQGHVRP